MRESFTYGTVGRAPGNRCLYLEEDWIHLLVDPDLHWKSDNLSKDEGRLTILHRKIYLT